MEFHFSYYLLCIIPFIHLFIYQMKIFNLNEPASCLKAFKSNNFFGLLFFLDWLIVLYLEWKCLYCFQAFLQLKVGPRRHPKGVQGVQNEP